jgi:hypothetical protein
MATADSINSQVQADDLRITIYSGGVVRFEGSSAQLVAEGLIPKNPKWPDRDITANWNDDQFHYGVHRVKPEGMKAPKAEWAKLDNWQLTRTPHNMPSWAELVIKEKTEEIERIKFSNSREGRIRFEKYWASHEDAAFQAFKVLIPGLVLPKRGRKPKDSLATKSNQD